MPFSPGDRIAHYEIVSLLGSGGMGEVYRAQDSRLRRAVAIKVLPAAFAADRERLQRFEREATALASLNHPNIAQVYGFEQTPTATGLVMELIDGEELSCRIGAMPVADAIAIATQLVSALESAHAAGIVHRDLKPANIMIRADGTVRVLDFGLAKIEADAISATVTAAGTVLGTVAYMSPEQASGRPVDKRCDIWAFGCVLFEMLAGRRAFDGESAGQALAQVIEREPDWAALPSATPPAVRALLKKCLQKDPARRLRDIGDAQFDLVEATPGSPGSAPNEHAGTTWSRRREYVAWVAALVAMALAVGALYVLPRTEIPEVTRFSISAPSAHLFGPTLIPYAAISPDGRQIAFVAGTSGVAPSLWVRSMSETQARKLPGTERAAWPFWSPDGRSVAFVADGRLLRTDLSGTPQLVTRIPDGFEGGNWGENGIVLFGMPRQGIFSVPASGGDPTQVTKPVADERSHHWPVWLPDQKHFLYRAENGVAYRGSIDNEGSTRLLTADSKVEFIAPGTVLFVRGADLMAQSYDVDRNELRGAPHRIAEQVRVATLGRASFFAAPTALMYYRRSAGLQIGLELVNVQGRMVRSLPLGLVRAFSLSPDNRLLAVHSHENDPVNGELWVVDIGRGSLSRIGADATHPDHPVWSPDGTRVAVTERRGLAVLPVAGAASGKIILEASSSPVPTDWSDDGKWILYSATASLGKGADIWAIPAAGGAPQPIVQTADDERGGVLSPDGRWLAYTSNESGRAEVYLQPFPPDGRKIPISVGGGASPHWDAHDLFYWGADGRVMRTKFTARAEGMAPDRPEALLMVPPVSTTFALDAGRVPYAVLRDGSGFIRVHAPADQPEEPATIVLNWRSLLQQQ